MTVDLQHLRIGYVPYSQALDKPGDRRRFVHYAKKRNLHFEIADPEKEYDVVILSERADLSMWSRYTKGKLVYDLIDSYLAIPRTNIKGCLRGLAKFVSGQSRYPQLNYWSAIESMCRRVDAVVCTTEEQKNQIAPFCSNVHIILDAHNMVASTVKSNYAANRPFRLVWEGLPHTVKSLELVRPVLEKVRQKYPLELHVVTDIEHCRYLGRYWRSSSLDEARRIFPDVKFHEWREGSCADIICSCDLALIPLDPADPFVAGKPENKLLLFWRMGMPVLTSATPAYLRVMEGAGIAMTCSSEAAWITALEKYLGDETERRMAGERGRVYAEANYGEEKILAMWDRLFCTLY